MNEKAKKIIEHYGINSQQRKLQEEIFELQEAIMTHELKQSVEYEIPLTEIISSMEHIIEEMADVMVVLTQLKEYYGISTKAIEEFMEYKINRQLKRIENGK